MQTRRQDKSSLDVLHVEVYVADWKSKKWLSCHTREPQNSTFYCGVDMFGPFYIKEEGLELKRYAAMFVCLASRAVHIEVTHQIDTDSIIKALPRIIARRGNVSLTQSDRSAMSWVQKMNLKEPF